MRRALWLAMVLCVPSGAMAGGAVAIGSDGRGLISYFDDSSQDLKIAHCSNVACTSATLTVLDSPGNVGTYSSVAIGADGLGVISYYDQTNGDLKVAHCVDVACTSATLTAVDTAGDVGRGASLAIGADGLPLISYHALAGAVGELKAAHCANAACTSATITTLATLGSVAHAGQETSVTVGSDGFGLIATNAFNAGRSELRVAHCSNLTCTAAVTSVLLTAPGTYLVMFPSIAPGADGLPLVTHTELEAPSAIGSAVLVTRCANLLCSAASAETVLNGGRGESTIAVGTDGLGLVAHGNPLKAVHCLDAGCTLQAQTVLDGAATRGVTGLAIGSDGLGLFTYSETINPYQKVAHCENVACTSATITVLDPGVRRADLSLSFFDTPDPVAGLQPFTYTARATNYGPHFAPNPRLQQQLPATAVFQGASGGGWSCTVAAGTLTCTHPGVAPFMTTPPLTVAMLAPPTAQVLSTTATLGSDAQDPSPSPPHVESTTVTAAPVADVSITTDDGGVVARWGLPFTWTITAGSAGPTSTSATVADAFPPSVTGVTWTCATTGGASCPAAGSGDINASVALPVGGTAVFTATGTVTPGSLGLVNTATITVLPGIYDPNPANDRSTATSALEPMLAHSLPPCRVVDTRPSGSPLVANTTRVFPVAGSCGVPADARAVAVNLTAVNPGGRGNLRVYPAGTTVPLASSLNFAPDRTRANNAIVALGVGGALAVFCELPAGSTATTHFVIDVYGYFR